MCVPREKYLTISSLAQAVHSSWQARKVYQRMIGDAMKKEKRNKSLVHWWYYHILDGYCCFWPVPQDLFGDLSNITLFLIVLEKYFHSAADKKSFFFSFLHSSLFCIQTPAERTLQNPTPNWPTSILLVYKYVELYHAGATPLHDGHLKETI